MTSGCSTRPSDGRPVGRAWIASTGSPPSPRNVIRSTSASMGPSASAAKDLNVALEDRGLGEAGEAVLDRAGPRLADALDLDEVRHAGA